MRANRPDKATLFWLYMPLNAAKVRANYAQVFTIVPLILSNFCPTENLFAKLRPAISVEERTKNNLKKVIAQIPESCAREMGILLLQIATGKCV